MGILDEFDDGEEVESDDPNSYGRILLASARVYAAVARMPKLPQFDGFRLAWDNKLLGILHPSGSGTDSRLGGRDAIISCSIHPIITPLKGFRKEAKEKALAIESAVRIVIVGRSVRAECVHVFCNEADNGIILDLTMHMAEGTLERVFQLLYPRSISLRERRQWRRGHCEE